MKKSKKNQNYPLIREPTNYQDIYNLKDKEEWFKAVNDELQNMVKIKVFTPIKYVPKNANIIFSRWVSNLKETPTET